MPALLESVLYLLLVSVCQILKYFSAFHHENDPFRGGDVLQRVTIESDDVGVEAGSDGADTVLQAKGFGGQRAGGN